MQVSSLTNKVLFFTRKAPSKVFYRMMQRLRQASFCESLLPFCCSVLDGDTPKSVVTERQTGSTTNGRSCMFRLPCGFTRHLYYGDAAVLLVWCCAFSVLCFGGARHVFEKLTKGVAHAIGRGTDEQVTKRDYGSLDRLQTISLTEAQPTSPQTPQTPKPWERTRKKQDEIDSDAMLPLRYHTPAWRINLSKR